MKRVFMVNSLRIEDPNPNEANLSVIFDMLVAKYPKLRYSGLFSSDAEPNPDNPEEIIYRIPLISSAKTNG